jgi:hypothetical protein
MVPQCRGLAFVFCLIAGVSQSTAFRARRSDSAAEKESSDEAFVPLSRPSRAAVGSAKRSDVASPQVAGGKSASFREALASVMMSKNKFQTEEEAQAAKAKQAEEKKEKKAAEPMKELATVALDSSGDPAQIEKAAKNMKEEDQKMLKDIKVDVFAKAQEMSGVTDPLGFFDPVGICTVCSEGRLCFYREVEIKHGRVAMLASLGFLVAEQFHPLFGGNVDVPSYIAFQQTPLQTFWPAVVAAIAIPETFSVFTFNPPGSGNGLWTMRADREPGDLGFDPLGLKPREPKDFKNMQNKELNNGRLAMIAAAGMIAQELASGQKLLR